MFCVLPKSMRESMRIPLRKVFVVAATWKSLKSRDRTELNQTIYVYPRLLEINTSSFFL